MYDDVRPGYPAELADAVRAHHGRPPTTVVELGAGTGKGTEVLARLGGSLTCIEPDPRMAEVLAARFPQATVVTETFEGWSPPPGGVDLIGCALAWHWLDPETRNQRAKVALAPGGTLAVFGHTYGYADPAVAEAISAALTSVDPQVTVRAEHWLRDDVAGSGVFTEVREQVWHTYPEYPKERYLRLVQTFGPFRRRSPEMQRAGLAKLDEVLGDEVTLDLRTTLVLAR